MNEEIVDAVKIFNIGSTLKKSDIKNADYNKDLYINRSENIRIGDIIDIFIRDYFCFKRDYDTIKKLNNYDDLKYVGFEEKNGEKSLLLEFYDNNKTMNSKYGYLLLALKRKNGIYSSHVINDCIGKDYDIREEKIDENIIESYISLFEKYKDLLNSYNFLQKEFIFGNGTNVLHIRVKGDILKSLKTIEIFFGNCFMNKSDYFDLEVEVLNENKFLKEEVIIDGKNIEPTSEIVSYLINNVYLNREYLPSLYEDKYAVERKKIEDDVRNNIIKTLRKTN